MRRKMKCLIVIVAGLFLLAACSVNETNQPVEPAPSGIEEETESITEEAGEMDEEEFRTRVADLCKEAIELTLALSRMGHNQLTYWENAVGPQTVTPEMIAQYGFAWLEENRGRTQSSIQADFNRLYAEYIELQNTAIAGEEIEEIQGELSAFFAYFSMVYQTVTEPGYSFENFAFNMSTGIRGVRTSGERLDELLFDEPALFEQLS